MATRNEAIDAIFASRILTIEFSEMFIGDLLGWGASRYVFVNRMNPRQVIKVDMGDMQANAQEWTVWNHVKFVQEVNQWFAPCYQISDCGSIMTQARCRPAKKFPEMLPRFFTDTKKTNFGMYQGRFVCFDYNSHLMLEYGMGMRMQKAKWWEHNP